MKKAKGYGVLMVVFLLLVSLTSSFCDKKKDIAIVSKKKAVNFAVSFDSSLVTTFYAKYPKLVLYKKQVV